MPSSRSSAMPARNFGGRKRCGCAIVTAPTRYANTLVVGDFEGYLHWLSPDDGSFLARERAAGQRISAAPLVVGQNVYVQGDDGTVAAYTLRRDEEA